MRYALALLTHGEAPTLDEAIQSFHRWVDPRPDALLAVVDGEQSVAPPDFGMINNWNVYRLLRQEGFCVASATLWELARVVAEQESLTHVFWLENDFRFFRPINLAHLARELDQHPQVAQMALMRQPVNRDEERRGGVLAEQQTTRYLNWTEHSAFWTTNPSLIPTSLISEVDWPDGPECEGKLGIGLRERGYRFGYWGNGRDAWVSHEGRRDGTGKGY